MAKKVNMTFVTADEKENCFFSIETFKSEDEAWEEFYRRNGKVDGHGNVYFDAYIAYITYSRKGGK